MTSSLHHPNPAKKRTLHRKNKTTKKGFTDCRLRFALLLIVENEKKIVPVCWGFFHAAAANHFAAIIIISAAQLAV